jgi:hypothetical protein
LSVLSFSLTLSFSPAPAEERNTEQPTRRAARARVAGRPEKARPRGLLASAV